VGLLLWATRPQSGSTRSPDQILQTLSEDRHYYRLPQILQSLKPDDLAFLQSSGQPWLVERLRNDRRRIALRYLDDLQKDFASLLEVAGVLAMMAPDLAPVEEWERLKLNVRFAFYCHYLRWRLRFGLAPWRSFSKLSEMAINMNMRLEAVTSRIGERAAMASELPSILE
jgi:hypothetical protein